MAGRPHPELHLTRSSNFLESFVSALFSGRHPLTFDKKGRVFLDRNPKMFAVILDFLRSGVLCRFEDRRQNELLEIELQFFGLDLSPHIPKIFASAQEFIFDSDMDKNGLFYFLGSRGGNWSNPFVAARLKLELSSQGGSTLHSLVDRVGESAVENLYSSSGPQWICVTLASGEFSPTGYWLKQESTH